jgi:ATP-binding protein involved in chromosome partitioning
MPDGSQVDVFGKGGGETLAGETGVPFLGSIPLDPAVREAGDGGVPAILADPESGVSKALTSVAEQIAAKVSMHVMLKDNVLETD